ncbi:MAG: amidohydrolase [Lachnospiraceae bacterium]|nr:amidohydrolase [Lachnospiraceae bacterium]
MRIIDAHTHIFPSKIAFKASESIGNFYGIPMHSDASPESLLRLQAELGSEHCLVCSSALSPAQVETINNFIVNECNEHPEFIGLAAMHKDYENFEEELDRVKSLGLKGVKFHHDMQGYAIDDPKCMPIYEAMERKGMILLLHMGDARYEFTNPHRLKEIALRFPNLTIVGAHFGGYSEWDEAYRMPKLPNVYYDTSSSLFMLEPQMAVRFIDHFGPEKYFFGSDFPMWNPKQELDRFMNLGLSDEVNKMILYDNFARVFDLKD